MTTRSPQGTVNASAEAPARTHGLFGAAFGTALEWYDWGIYGTFAPFFAAQFFPAEDRIAALLGAWAVFFVGFVARPVGGWYFGHVSDTIGRKRSMVLTAACAGGGALIIGLAPGYATIGLLAPALLVLGRIIQGLAHGGEMPAAGAFIGEVAKPENRGAWSSIIYIFGTIGGSAGVLLGAILARNLSPEAMNGYGWRIAFIIGAIGSFGAMLYRMRMRETAIFEAQTGDAGQGGSVKEKPNLLAEVWKARRKALQIIGLTVGLTVAYYLWTTVLTAYHISVLGPQTAGYDRASYNSNVLWATLAANVWFIATLPFWGMLSDRIGRKPVVWTATVGTAIVAVPLLQWVDGSIGRLIVTLVVANFFTAAAAAIFPGLLTELVPTRIRTIGVGIPYAIAVALFGGTAPYLQTWMSTHWGLPSFAWYIVALMIVSTIVVFTLPETKGKDLATVQ